MHGALRIVVTLALFTGVMALVVWRPRGWHEAWWAVLGAALMIAFRSVALSQAIQTANEGHQALLFLVALLALSALVEQSGFFDWAAAHCARRARGDARALYRNVFILGSLTTAFLSLDTTAVILTPVVLSFTQRLGLPRRPYVLTCAFLVNAASLPLPVSNLTNLLLASAFELPFARFASRMIVPQAVALGVSYALFRIVFQRELPARFEPGRLPDPASVIVDRGYFNACCVVLVAVFVGYLAGPLVGVDACRVAFIGVGLLALASLRARLGVRWLRSGAWGVVPFALGLFVLVRGVENLGLAPPLAVAAREIARRSSWLSVPVVAIAASGLANVLNNLPATLIARTVLQPAHDGGRLVLAALVGTDIGANLTVVGSLATVLVLRAARNRGTDVSAGELLRVAAVSTPVVVLTASLALAASFALFP